MHRQLGMLMGTRNETLDLSQPGFQFNGLAGRRITTGDMDLTETVSESILGYYPTLQSVLFRSSCPLHLRQGTADPLRFLQVRRPTSRVHVSIQLEDSIRLTPSRISHNLPGVATRTSTPRASIRPCFCADIPPTIAATLTGGGALGVASPFASSLSETFRFPFFDSPQAIAAGS